MDKAQITVPNSFPGKHNRLFRPGPNGWLNACVGKNGGYANFDRLARGFFCAGKLIVDQLLKDRSNLDLLIYPLVSNYRQGIENMLKCLAEEVIRLHDSNEKVRYTHQLLDNWQIVRKHLVDLGVEGCDLEKAEHVLSELVEIDATGETFRYPLSSRKKQRHLEDTTHINVEVFAAGIVELTDFLEQVHWGISALLDQKLEMEHELRSM